MPLFTCNYSTKAFAFPEPFRNYMKQCLLRKLRAGVGFLHCVIPYIEIAKGVLFGQFSWLLLVLVFSASRSSG